MRVRNKILPETKIIAAKEYLKGEASIRDIASKYGVSKSSLHRWVGKYKSTGIFGFKLPFDNDYTDKPESKVADLYLSGEGFYPESAVKHKIPSHSIMAERVSLYNSHERLNNNRSGGLPIMTKGRKTTYKERIEIVKYCIENGDNYTQAAQKYKVSYQQVYGWVSKYNKGGKEALKDRRGRRKSEDQMTEMEKLRAQNRLLRAENEKKQIEIDFLKKLEEIERRRY